MNWTRHNEYAIKSHDGRFSICRLNVGDRIDYELWRVSGNQFITARRGVKHNDASRLIAINELKEEADEYAKSEDK